MKAKRIVGVVFLAVGLLFVLLGAVAYGRSFQAAAERIHTTGRILRIEERETGDPEVPTEHTVYVAFDANGEEITARLNTYRTGFQVGDSVDLYYFANDLQTVYEQGSQGLLLLVILAGTLFAILGAILSVPKRPSLQARSADHG